MAERPIAEHTDVAGHKRAALRGAGRILPQLPGPAPEVFLLPSTSPATRSLSPRTGRAGGDLRPRPTCRTASDVLELGWVAGARCRCGWHSTYPEVARSPRSPTPRAKAKFTTAAAPAAEDLTSLHRHHRRHERVRSAGRGRQYDRVVSVEMFEHMANWRAPAGRGVRTWLKLGRAAVHPHLHPQDRALPLRGQGPFRLDRPVLLLRRRDAQPQPDAAVPRPVRPSRQDWRWSGAHYEKTALHWLENYDRNVAKIRPVLRAVYGDKAVLWHRRWRLFFLATAGLFGHRGGEEWGVSHYRLKPA